MTTSPDLELQKLYIATDLTLIAVHFWAGDIFIDGRSRTRYDMLPSQK